MDGLLRAALGALDGAAGCTQIPNPAGLDRGTRTYRAGGWKIKTMPAPALRLHHEACVYQARERQGLHRGTRHGHLDDGHPDAGRWLAVPWVPGPTLWEAFAPARNAHGSSAARGGLLDAALAAAAELRRWHRDAWLHGDVQPANIVVAGRAAMFIDLEYARHPRLRLPYPYRGGIAETTAPEVARQLVDSQQHAAELHPEAEVYALGAAIRWAWTGHPPAGRRDPGDAGPGRLLHAIAHGPPRALREDRPYPFPELEDLIEQALHPDPHRRALP
ncbi:hypothetical protein [Yinghuangia seranimata]|uniref:hypothetical protein n=1 Tax=Yinghuangia seranimata TaxID=408067 RepID=UPI00248CDFE6|nr:hypothetical protein [Yinghuangia seranimata]MDI2127625.1 hypothetical protein [Yinghuangia seranimata]